MFQPYTHTLTFPDESYSKRSNFSHTSSSSVWDPPSVIPALQPIRFGAMLFTGSKLSRQDGAGSKLAELLQLSDSEVCTSRSPIRRFAQMLQVLHIDPEN